MTQTLIDRATALGPDLVRLRRDLHRHPELGFREERTAALLADTVEALGYRVRRGVGRTGVVADLESGDGPTVALRADMDALPIQEVGEHEYRSQAPGVMHACGHDAHCAGLVGAARLLAELAREGALPPGRVRLLFQPSEEGCDDEGLSGAMRMVADGAMEGVDYVLGLHVGGHLPSGVLFFHEGAMLAGSEELAVDVHGRSSHAARPEQGVDALVLACQGVLAAQQAVSRRLGPHEQGVVTFGRIEGGTAHNVVADRVRVLGTLRYFDPDVRERLVEGVRGAFEGLERQGARVEVRVGPGYPPLINDAQVTRTVRAEAEALWGPDRVLEATPMMGAEDFAVLAREAPGTFFWLGAALPDPREHHSPTFDIDETVLAMGAATLAAGALRLLRGAGPGA
ncbi:MAG: amidohydrolase [Gemmatimonadetes bacterium]|nr:MAG: amidohydrolase [Gemmatimonadota bacterium]